MDKSILDDLNPIQRAACTATEGPVMIIAGAGSGKTRVLTYRIAHLVEKGVDPFNILSLTFTNKAAREMKDRISRLVGSGSARNLWMGTFHSVFAKLLRIESEKIGYPQNFTIYDTDDSKSLIKEILKQLNLDDKVYKPSMVLNRISSAKNNLIGPKQYQHNSILQTEDQSSQKPLLGQIYEIYNRRCFRSGAMDFDDLLFQTNLLLRDHPDILLKYQDKFRYILVDEYQDTNFSQYVIIKQLAARFENICVVGDDAQSIYAFRGANIQNILNFEKDYPDLKTFKLEQNYRSTQTIVNAANSVIEKNKDQFRKTVWTSNETGEKIRIIRANSDNEEGLKVASSIWELRMQNQLSNQSFAILYRTNAQSRSMEEALRKLNIPYKIYGGVSFYQRKEIKDLLAYFRLTINRNDDESLRRIINYPARGIGNTTMDKIEVAAAEHDVSLWTVIENLKDFQLSISSGTLTKIGDFVSMMKSFSLLSPFKDAFETANQIASGSGILKDLYNDKSPEGVSRYENIQELLNGIKDFTDTQRTPQEDELKDSIKVEVNPADLFHAEVSKEFRTLDEFMQEISLMTDADTEKEDEKDLDKVSLMTIHAAKGLEFPFVYIVGLEENLFPSQLSLQSRSDLEEERRLFYVAITRAEKRATISYAATRYRFGSLIYCEPSRFIDELDPKYLDFPEPTVQSKFGSSTFDKIKGNFKPNEKPIGFKKKNEEEIKGFNPKRKLISIPKNNSNANSGTSFSPSGSSDSNTLIRAGVVVSHDKFGRGTVLNVEGESPNLKATIQFESHGQKMLLLKYAQLRVIS